MSKILKLRKGASIIEYMIVVLFILAAMFVFQYYIIRGFAGRWKAIGDGFGSGKQYDPRPYGVNGEGGGTLECFYFQEPTNALINLWVETRCYESCLRSRNGFGNPSDMGDCRGQCNEEVPAYQDCGDSLYSVRSIP